MWASLVWSLRRIHILQAVTETETEIGIEIIKDEGVVMETVIVVTEIEDTAVVTESRLVTNLIKKRQPIKINYPNNILNLIKCLLFIKK